MFAIDIALSINMQTKLQSHEDKKEDWVLEAFRAVFPQKERYLPTYCDT